MLLQDFPSLSSKIEDWKGADIITFQEELHSKVKGSISEKSFYTYFKNSPKKLPRLDVLNLLSQYAGYANWKDFQQQHQTQRKNKKSFIVSLIAIILLGFSSTFLYYSLNNTNQFSFCFIDADREQPIIDIPLDIIILNERESPHYLKSDSLGCFQWESKDPYLHFVVQSPYHKTDTIYRSIDRTNSETLQLRTDDYALALYYYANGKVEDWKNRRKELEDLIANDAIILQILPYNLGVEVYHKNDFINKLTTPIPSLQHLEIIETQKKNGKIVKLKFRVSL